jgi:hypothetical protein
MGMGRFFKFVIGTIASVVLGETAREVLKDIFKHALYGGIIENIESAVGLKAADMVVQIVSHIIPIGIAGLVVWIVWTVAIAYDRRAHSIIPNKQPSATSLSTRITLPEQPEMSDAPAPSVAVGAAKSPPAAPESNRVDETRVFVRDNITPSYLVNIFKDNIDIEATTQTKKFIGKWMKVDGAVHDIYTVGSDTVSLVLEPAYDGDISRQFLVYLFFHEPWIEKIVILRRGDKVSVIGKIDTISAIRLKLENGELKD